MDQYVVLNNGVRMPIIGLGTWMMTDPNECKNAIRAALDAGYRHIDTAYIYQNEAFIGEVLQEYFKSGKLKREEIFVTTKVWQTNLRSNRLPMAVEESLENVQLDYVDMLLVHGPMPLMPGSEKYSFGATDENGKFLFDTEVKLEDTWREMQDVYKAGKARAIGVSNFNAEQVERMCMIGGVKPATNQVECQLYNQQPKLANCLKEHGIVLTAYSSLGSPGLPVTMRIHDIKDVLDNSLAKRLAKEYNKTVAQSIFEDTFHGRHLQFSKPRETYNVLLRHLIQKGFIVIPKSTNPSRLKENISVFDFSLTDDHMDQLNKENQNRPTNIFTADNFKDHPEFPFDNVVPWLFTYQALD